MRQFLIETLHAAAPELAGLPIAMRPFPDGQDPVWWSSSAVLGEQFVAKYAWSEAAGQRLAHEIGVLRALAGSAVPFLPEVVVGSTDPVLLVTRRVPGSSLFEVIDSIDRDQAGAQLAQFLAALHQPTTRSRAEAEIGELRMPYAQLETTTVRTKIDRWVRPDQVGQVRNWCDWIDETTGRPAPRVLVHGDLHGDNQVWQRDELRVVVDFETVGIADPEFDLRAIPGTGPGVELLQSTVRHYGALSIDRIMAWHLRNSLGDVIWRSEAGIHLPDHRTPPEWIADLDARLTALGIEIPR